MRKFILNITTYSDVQKHTRLTFILQLCCFFPYFFSVSLDFEIKWSTINGVKYNWWSSPPESRPVFTVGTWNQSAGKVWDAPDLPARGQVWYNCINNQNQPFFHLLTQREGLDCECICSLYLYFIPLQYLLLSLGSSVDGGVGVFRVEQKVHQKESREGEKSMFL